jgi:hypothetical protein
LTPLQSTFGTPHEGFPYISDLELISRDEIPLSDYFFSKKRRAVLKQETIREEKERSKGIKLSLMGRN